MARLGDCTTLSEEEGSVTICYAARVVGAREERAQVAKKYVVVQYLGGTQQKGQSVAAAASLRCRFVGPVAVRRWSVCTTDFSTKLCWPNIILLDRTGSVMNGAYLGKNSPLTRRAKILASLRLSFSEVGSLFAIVLYKYLGILRRSSS